MITYGRVARKKNDENFLQLDLNKVRINNQQRVYRKNQEFS